MKNPTVLRERQGRGFRKSSAALPVTDVAIVPVQIQPIDPVAIIALRAGVAVSTARVFAEINQWGRQ